MNCAQIVCRPTVSGIHSSSAPLRAHRLRLGRRPRMRNALFLAGGVPLRVRRVSCAMRTSRRVGRVTAGKMLVSVALSRFVHAPVCVVAIQEYVAASPWLLYCHVYSGNVYGDADIGMAEQGGEGICHCSTCNTVITSHRYKCASCDDFNLCRACYRYTPQRSSARCNIEVDIHVHVADKYTRCIPHTHSSPCRTSQVVPIHRVLPTRTSPIRTALQRSHVSRVYAIVTKNVVVSIQRSSTLSFDSAMTHIGVRCAQYVRSHDINPFPSFILARSCMQEIVGARFHCAICENVDICSNCDAAGLPGNLDSDDGGHVSSHIMIKVRPGRPSPCPARADT